jgi:hypothetical protein
MYAARLSAVYGFEISRADVVRQILERGLNDAATRIEARTLMSNTAVRRRSATKKGGKR